MRAASSAGSSGTPSTQEARKNGREFDPLCSSPCTCDLRGSRGEQSFVASRAHPAGAASSAPSAPPLLRSDPWTTTAADRRNPHSASRIACRRYPARSSSGGFLITFPLFSSFLILLPSCYTPASLTSGRHGDKNTGFRNRPSATACRHVFAWRHGAPKGWFLQDTDFCLHRRARPRLSFFYSLFR